MKGIAGTGAHSRLERERLYPIATGACSECGSSFRYSRTGRPRVTCGDDCRRIRNNRLSRKTNGKRACGECGKEYVLNYIGRPKTTCSRECLAVARAKRKSAGEPTQVVHCGFCQREGHYSSTCGRRRQ